MMITLKAYIITIVDLFKMFLRLVENNKERLSGGNQ